MTDLIPITCEARIMGFSKQSRADGDWTELRIHIHPDETPHSLFLLPLKTHIKLSISGPDEPAEDDAAEPAQTQTAPAAVEDAPKLKGGPVCKRAVMLCKNPAFQAHMNCAPSEPATAARLRYRCGNISSRSELDHNPEAGRVFEKIEHNFWASQQGRTDPEVARQRAAGPS